MRKTIAFFLGTHEDWGGASRALLNFVRSINRHRFQPLVVLTKEGKLSAALSEEGIQAVIRKNSDRCKNLAAYTVNIFDAYRFFKIHKVDLIHMNCGAIGWKPPEILAAKIASIPIISHLHITDINPSSYLRYSTAVISVSNYVAKHSVTFGVPTHAINNVSFIARFGNGKDIRRELGYEIDQILILFMGQMIRQKGLQMLVDAFKLVPNGNARLLLAGAIRETEGAYSRKEIDDLVLQDSRIKYLGFRTDAENLYHSADMLVMPSQWEEPCAMIIFEAAAAGRPLIATATGGTPEVLRHGETGFLVDRADVNDLARRMQLLVDDAALRLKMGNEAKRVALDEYSRGPVRKLEALYESL